MKQETKDLITASIAACDEITSYTTLRVPLRHNDLKEGKGFQPILKALKNYNSMNKQRVSDAIETIQKYINSSNAADQVAMSIWNIMTAVADETQDNFVESKITEEQETLLLESSPKSVRLISDLTQKVSDYEPKRRKRVIDSLQRISAALNDLAKDGIDALDSVEREIANAISNIMWVVSMEELQNTLKSTNKEDSLMNRVYGGL